MKKRSIEVGFSTVVLVFALHNAYAADTDNAGQNAPATKKAENASEMSWKDVDKFDLKQVKTFVSNGQDAKDAKSAKTLLTILSRLEDYKSNNYKQQAILLASAMGDRWTDSEKSLKKRTRSMNKFILASTSWEPGFGLMAEGVFGTGGTVTMSHNGPALPVLDGSILAISTSGIDAQNALLKMGSTELFGGFYISTKKVSDDDVVSKGTVYFAAIKDVGFIHLFGDATIVGPDGKTNTVVETEK